MNTDESYDAFINKLNDIINAEVQTKTIKIPPSRKVRDPWMTRGLITSSRELNKLHKRKIGKEKTHPHSIKFYEYRNKQKQVYYHELLTKYKHDIRKTWGVINSLIGRSNDKTGISETFKINNTQTNDPKIISNEFCNFFTNIGKKYASEIPPPNSLLNSLWDTNNSKTCSWPQQTHMKLVH